MRRLWQKFEDERLNIILGDLLQDGIKLGYLLRKLPKNTDEKMVVQFLNLLLGQEKITALKISGEIRLYLPPLPEQLYRVRRPTRGRR
jgi:hypothetical protein